MLRSSSNSKGWRCEENGKWKPVDFTVGKEAVSME